ncbi:MAG: ATPase, T2SS/T4P/T4SS family [Myxococcales bacterium]
MTHPVFEFEILGSDGARSEIRSAEGSVTLGRDGDIKLPAQNVSRRHCACAWGAEGLKITDTSSNGTGVDDLLLKRATRVVPKPHAELRIGAFLVRVKVTGLVKLEVSKDSNGQRPKVESTTPSSTKAKVHSSEAAALMAQLSPIERRGIHRRLLENLDLPAMSRAAINADVIRPEVLAALGRIVADCDPKKLPEAAKEQLILELTDEALGLGPLERLLSDPDVNEIMVVDPHTIFVERCGKMELTGLRFTDADSVRAVIERIVTPLGRRIDESTPLVDARLKDGSRVNAVIPPLALRGPCITIRKFAKEPLTMADLVLFGSLSTEMAKFLERCVKVRKNIIISGGTGSGKTTLLNVLSAAIPSHERVVTVEDAAELQLGQPHVVSLESRPPNLEGKGEYTIRDLVKNALRMRPDRIVVGECRGGEAIDMLQAMNTGHEGSLTTTHANSPKEAVARVETLCLMAGLDLPVRAIRQQIASSIHLIVQQSRLSDGLRRISSIAEVVGLSDEGEVELREIFSYRVSSAVIGQKVVGEYLASGYLPSFLDQFLAQGLCEGGAVL